MEFRVLGPLEIARDGTAAVLPGAKPKKLLARLLVDAGSVVSVDSLAEALWPTDETRPANGPATIQVYVSNLRRVIDQPGTPSRSSMIRTVAPGYLIDLAGCRFDAHLLAELVGEARSARAAGESTAAVHAAERAIALLRGEPFADFAYEDWAYAAIRQLTELATSAQEELYAALLAASRHEEAVPPLQALVARQPFRERLRWLLMLALYRAGRQADALRCYADGRELMIDELGVEPGNELRQLEARILQQDPDLQVPPSGRALAPPPVAKGIDTIVGRSTEQSAIAAALERAGTGRVEVIAIEGAPGIGKSALARWALDHAKAVGFDTGFGRAQDFSGSPPLWPWTEALRTLGPVEAEGMRPAELLSIGADPSGAASDNASSAFALFVACADLLSQRSQNAPVLVVLDDVQWAGQASIDLVRFLARSSLRARVAVIVAHRPVAADHALSLLAADLATERSFIRLRLRGLDRSAVAALVERLIGSAPPNDIIDAIADRTGGNPFFVEELVALLHTGDGRLDPRAAAVPRSVQEVVRRRASALSSDAVEVLTAAAFMSGPFSAVVPARLTNRSEREVRALFELAESDGLLVDEPGRLGWWRFGHDLVRHALYDAVPAVRRAETHLALGNVVVELLGERAEDHATELAAHFLRATSVGGAELAVRWSRAAARRSCATLAFDDAVHQLRRALLITRRELQDRHLECTVLVELASAARLAADRQTATRARERALELASQLGDPLLHERAQSPIFRGTTR